VPAEEGRVFARLAGGSAHTCGLTIDGAAWCWGNNSRGQLGDGSFTERAAPVAVASELKFASIDAGPEHTCALTSTGSAWCWGMNDRGQLGDSTTINRSIPVPVTGGRTFRAITAAGTFWGHTCALTENDEAYCWGYNGIGQLGRGTFDNVPHPTPGPVSGGLTFASLATGLGDQVCGITGAGAAYCWGHNGRGALGDGSTIRSLLPVAVTGGLVFSRLVTGGWGEGGHTCGLTISGAAWCWGDNEAGAVGDGSMIDRRAPTAVAGGLSFTSIDAGLRHTCARTTAGTVYCWGSGRTGQLGANSISSSGTPVKVVGQL
jgi:alpha-tubulin suppressor-like RCC1 family protein